MMKKYLLILVLAILLSVSQAQNYKKVVHLTDPEARCLDGSPPAIYVHQGSEKDKFMLFLEGGGFCQGETQAQVIEQCYQRSKTMFGSSNFWPDQLVGQGYLSINPAENSFSNWTKVIFAYCDSALHQGYRTQPLKYKNSSLFFRGSKIMKAQFQYLQKNYNISKASKVVFTGSSAGAVGAYLWSGFVRQLFPKDRQLYIIPDSGMALDFPAHGSNNHHLATQLKTLYKISNFEEGTPLELCNIHYVGDQWKCFLIEYNYQFLVGNFMYINSQYDSWAIPNILKLNCIQNSTTGTGATLSKCNKAQMQSIQKYRQKYMLVLFDILQLSNKNSCWSIACSNHVYACLRPTYQSNLQRIPEIDGTTVRDAIERFVLKEQDRIVVMDLLAYPQNHPCAI